jgi:hypothetical protein
MTETITAKLDWLPLYIQRLKGSEAWKMPDYQFGWYMKLLIESADSPIPGYLPGSTDKLWRLAGAKSQPYFEKWGGCELVSRLFRRAEIEGQAWIYNERMLKTIHEQNLKLARKKKGAGRSIAAPAWAKPAPSLAPGFAPPGSGDPGVTSVSSLSTGFPEWVPRQTWENYMEMRKRIRKPLTEHAVELAIGKLASLAAQGHEPRAVLEQSILNSWQGLFPVREELGNGKAKAHAAAIGGFERFVE